MLRVDKTQQNTEPDNNSDVDYIMPRVCFQFLYFIHKIIFLLFIHFKSILGILRSGKLLSIDHQKQ